MKVSELTPEQKAELQKRYKEAGLTGPIHLMSVEKVEEKILVAKGNKSASETKEIVSKELTYDTDISKQVLKINEEGNEYQAIEPTKLKIIDKGLDITMCGKIPAGQSINHPKNSLIIKIENEKFVLSAELANKMFCLD